MRSAKSFGAADETILIINREKYYLDQGSGSVLYIPKLFL